MRPQDDPTWPLCFACEEPEWCNHRRDLFAAAKDAPEIYPGLRICCPVFPAHDVFAEVSIKPDEVAPGMAEMALVRQDVFTDEEEFFDLGVWTRGEGRFSIAAVIQDWIIGHKPDKCQASTHGFNEEIMLSKIKGTIDEKVSNWYLAFYHTCGPCYTRISSVVSGGISNNFGLNMVTSTPPPQGGHNQSIMQTLKTKYS